MVGLTAFVTKMPVWCASARVALACTSKPSRCGKVWQVCAQALYAPVRSISLTLLLYALVLSQIGCEPRLNRVAVSGKVAQSDGTSTSSLALLLRADGFHEVVQLGPDGRFSVAEVPVPYDAILVDDGCVATIFQGLTRADPTLTSSVVHGGAHSATITGRFTGLPLPDAGNPLDLVWSGFVSSWGTSAGLGFVLMDQGTFQVSVNWTGPNAIQGDLHALLTHQTSSSLSRFDGYGVLRGIGLHDGAALALPDMALQAVRTSELSGSVVRPDSYYYSSYFVSPLARPGPVGGFGFASYLNANPFAFAVPDLPDVGIQLRVTAIGEDGGLARVQQAVQLAASGLSIVVPAPVSLHLPADGATVASERAVFDWSPMEGSPLYQVAVGNGGCGQIEVFSSDTSFALPDLSQLGISTRGPMSWNVSTLSAPATVDALATGVNLRALFDGDLVVTSSAARQLTLR